MDHIDAEDAWNVGHGKGPGTPNNKPDDLKVLFLDRIPSCMQELIGGTDIRG